MVDHLMDRLLKIRWIKAFELLAKGRHCRSLLCREVASDLSLQLRKGEKQGSLVFIEVVGGLVLDPVCLSGVEDGVSRHVGVTFFVGHSVPLYHYCSIEAARR